METHSRSLPAGALLIREFGSEDGALLVTFAAFARKHALTLGISANAATVAALSDTLRRVGDASVILR